MALTFGGVASDNVNHGTGLGTFTVVSVLMWVYPTTLTAFRYPWTNRPTAERPGCQWRNVGGTVDEIGVNWTRATTNMVYITNNANITTNKWWFIGVTVDQGAAAGELANIYVGDLSTRATECTYDTTQDGTGAFNSNAGGDWITGNGPGVGAAFQGRIAVVGVWPGVALTLAQLQDWQFRPRQTASQTLYTHYGFAGTGTQPDWSGNANSGAVTGATVGDHVPLGPPFGCDRGWMGAFTAAAAGAARVRLPRLSLMGVQ